MTDEFNFDLPVQRHGTDSYKWDTVQNADVLPLWVADMDFMTAPCVVEALRKRVEHGVFGYVKVPDSYYRSVTDWFSRRHGFQMDKSWILYTSGVVPAISAIIKAVTRPGDKILVQTPVFNCFFSSIRNNGCVVEKNELVYSNCTYTIDFDDFERKAALPEVKVFLLCNPHNPAGRVWTRNELERMGEICLRHGVFVVADEIHCELTMPGYTYTPFGSLGDQMLLHSATCTSPSKAFNTAGLQIANITVADGEVRRKIDRALNINEVCDVNPFGVIALQAAYNEGEPWLKALLDYLYANYCFLKEFFSRQLPQFPVVTLEGTYLVWVDCSALPMNSKEICDKLLREGRVLLNNGEMYGESEHPFVRINIACPRAVLREGLERIAAVLG